MIFTASLFRLPSDRYAAKFRRTLQASLANGWIEHEHLNMLAVIAGSDPTSVAGRTNEERNHGLPLSLWPKPMRDVPAQLVL